jgi:hypothetical protein
VDRISADEAGIQLVRVTSADVKAVDALRREAAILRSAPALRVRNRLRLRQRPTQRERLSANGGSRRAMGSRGRR